MTRCLTCHALIPRGPRCRACQRGLDSVQLARLHAMADDQARAAKRSGPDGSWSTLRRRAIDRDGGCVMPPPHEGRLEVDHIIPLAAGGSNEIANLRVLCRAHHMGKGS